MEGDITVSMYTPLICYTQNMAGYVLRVSSYVMNARYATLDVMADDKMLQKPRGGRNVSESVYNPLSNPLDRSIKIGEMLFETNNKKKRAMNQQPNVRSVLNGIHVKSTGNGGDRLKALRNLIHPIGPSVKDVVCNAAISGGAPSDDPVVLLAGIATTTNLGGTPICAGDSVEWFLVDPKTRHQYDDGVNVFAPHRAAIGYRTTTLETDASNKDMLFAIACFCNTLLIHNNALGDMTAKSDKTKAAAVEFQDILFKIESRMVRSIGNVCAIATSSAQAGCRFNGMIQPFAHIKIVKKSIPHITVAATIGNSGSAESESEDSDDSPDPPSKRPRTAQPTVQPTAPPTAQPTTRPSVHAPTLQATMVAVDPYRSNVLAGVTPKIYVGFNANPELNAKSIQRRMDPYSALPEKEVEFIMRLRNIQNNGAEWNIKLSDDIDELLRVIRNDYVVPHDSQALVLSITQLGIEIKKHLNQSMS